MNSVARLCVAAVALFTCQPAWADVHKTPEGFLQARAGYRFSFPRDHAAHKQYRTEWWYFTGHLAAAGGRRFGYELTFFRIGITPDRVRRSGVNAWHSTQLYPAHFAITDERTGRFVFYEDFAREALGQAGASETKAQVHVHDWSLGGNMPFVLHAARGGDAIDLHLFSQKPPAVHGTGGISRKGPCPSCASHYYSYTHLLTEGRIKADGIAYRVRGLSWMDHEYGSDELQPNQTGWDWFSIQLDDGREAMLYRLRQKDGSETAQSSGSLIERNGAVRFLPLSAFSVRETQFWVSPHTRARYPSSWTLQVKGLGTLLVSPLAADQELVNASNGVTYWEGAVVIRASNGRRIGEGYVELTGYAQPVVL
ncbi:MAG: lipocalin-like domain-containing protein [Vulcanimicrobiaceae bacterium]